MINYKPFLLRIIIFMRHFILWNRLDKEQAKIQQCLLKLDNEWLKILKPFGVLGFTEYSTDNYDIENLKTTVSSVPYY